MQGEDLTVSVLPFRNLLAAAYAWLTRTECVGEWQAGPPGYVGGVGSFRVDDVAGLKP